MGVALGCADTCVAEEGLDVTDVSTAFKEVGGKGVAEAVDGNALLDVGTADGFVKDLLGGTDREGSGSRLAREKPGFNVEEIEILCDEIGGFIRKQGTPVFAALPIYNVNYPSRQIYVFLPKGDHFTDPKPGGINQHQ